MSTKNLSKLAASFLVILLVAPAALLVAPSQTHAQIPVTVTSDFSLSSIGDWIENTISAVANPTTAASSYWTMLKGSVLDPLAHALAQMVLKQITASVVDAINGKNSHPQFVTNLAGHLQKVGDQVGLSFIAQFTKTSNSPFAAAIGSAVQQNYLQQTSLAGFFAANQCTLNTKTSPNLNSFLAGNFSQGSWGTWFSLTGPTSNNPFILYQNVNGQAASVVGAAQANQRQSIAQNNGFLSWCSSGSTDTSGGGVGKSCTDFANGSDCNGNLVCVQTSGKSTGTCQPPTAATSDDTASTCYNKDGTPGTVETPGSVIHDELSKTLGSGVDSLVSVHDFNQMVDTILSALATKIVTTGLSALSGGGSGSGGGGRGGSGSFTNQLGSGSNATNPNAASVAGQANSLAQHSIAQLATYTNAWQTIESAANAASSSAQSVIACETSHGIADSFGAQTALATEIPPVIASAQQAFGSASTTNALALQVEADAANYTSGTAGAGGSLAADTQALAAAPPTATDIANAQSQSSASGRATSSSPTSLIVSGGSLLDQMQLIQTNAANAVQACENPVLQII